MESRATERTRVMTVLRAGHNEPYGVTAHPEANSPHRELPLCADAAFLIIEDHWVGGFLVVRSILKRPWDGRSEQYTPDLL